MIGRKAFHNIINRLFKFCIVAFLVGFSLSIQAQSRRVLKGIEHYNNNEFQDAIEQFKKAREENDSSYTIVKYLANANRKLRVYDKAEVYYLLAVNSDSVKAEDYLYFGQALKANGKLSAAKEQFLKFAELNQNNFLGNIMLQSIDEIEVWDNEPKGFAVKSESQLNSIYSEYGFLLFKDQVMFTSNRDVNENSPESSSFDGTPFFSIYQFDSSEIKSNGKGKIKMSNGLINTDYNDGPLTINEQEDKLVITRIDNQMRGKDFVNRRKLFEADFVNGRWKNFKELPFNSDEYSVCHAHLSDSGRTLYFASNMPGGQGGFDLYQSNLENNSWQKPKNLGKGINTKGNELFPYQKNNVLYFSSDGFSGYGGLDIYSSIFNDGWQAPENMKSPINSVKDDFSIYFINDTSGFYASDRDGGKGFDDLYRFKKKKPAVLVDIHGVYELKGIPLENVKVLLVDNKDSIISIQYTDLKGRFKFVKLPYSNNFQIKIDELEEEIVKDGRVFLTDEFGNKLRLLNSVRNGEYTFKALPIEEFEGFKLLTAEEGSLLDKFKFAGRLYKKLPGDFTEKVMVYLLNPEGDVIDSLETKGFGYFDFKKLDDSTDYTIKLKEHNPDISLALESEYGRIYELISPNENGEFAISKSLDASLKILEAKNIGLTTLLAKIEHKGLPLKLVKVNIYNLAGILIGSSYTNDAGEFQFNRLTFDDSYLIKFSEVDEQLLKESLVYVINKDGDPLYLINQLKDGSFKFNSLPFDEYKLVQDKEFAFVPHIIKIAGQIYKKLPGDINDSMQVYVLDESGSIIDSIYTDSNGKFSFEKLSSDMQYTFQLKEQTTGMNLALLNDADEIIELATITENGSFSYKKLTYQVAHFEPIEEVDVQLVEDELNHEIMGQVYQKLPGDFQSGMKVFVYDEEGNLLGITETDEKGKFHFKKLQKDQNYFFKIEDEDDHFQLVTVDEFDRVIDKTIKNKHGQFKYTALSMDQHQLLLAEERDLMILDFKPEKISIVDFKIHYRFDSVEVRAQEKPKLLELIEKYKASEAILEVHSYTDNRGPSEYNKWLSKERTDKVIRFLSRNGFPRERIVGNYSGELDPIVDCETKECNNDDHYENRRTEFKLLNTIE